MAVDVVEDRRQSRGLTTSHCAGDQHNAVLKVGNLRELGWKIQVREIGNFSWNDAHHDRTAAALDEHIHTKAGPARQSVRHIASTLLTQGVDSLLVTADQVGCNVPRVVGSQHRKPWNLD